MCRPGKAPRKSFRSWRCASCWWRTTTATRSSFEELLRDADLEVEVVRARTVADAEHALPADIACVVLDLGLPDADGLAALHRLREAAPGVPMLVLTGLSDTARGLEAVAAGAQDYLVKGARRRRAARAVDPLRGRAPARGGRPGAAARRQPDGRGERAPGARPAAAPAGERPGRGRRQRLPARPRARAARWRLLRRGRGAPTARCTRSSATSAATTPTRRRSASACGSRGARSSSAAATVDEILGTMEQVLVHERLADEVFATACMVSVAADRRSAIVRVAGHPLPVLIAGGTAQELPGPASRPAAGRRCPSGQLAGDAGHAARGLAAAALHRRADRGPRRRRPTSGWAASGWSSSSPPARPRPAPR